VDFFRVCACPEHNREGYGYGRFRRSIDRCNSAGAGNNAGTITDIDGNFNIPNVPSDALLEVSYIGMQTQIIEVAGETISRSF
jgi:hypothetical protein